MNETEIKKIQGEVGIEEIKPSSESVYDMRTQIPISQGLSKYLEDQELGNPEMIALIQEHGLCVIGLSRLRKWAEQLPELIDQASLHFCIGDFSEIDQILDQICGEVLESAELKKKLIGLALDIPPVLDHKD